MKSLRYFLLCLFVLAISNLKSQTITIGTQIWTQNNLDVEKFRNGDLILEAKTNEEWTMANENKQPAWCYFNNDSSKNKKFGKLYNWYAVNDIRGLAPEGYHIPTDEEWKILTTYLGGESVAGSRMKAKEWDQGFANLCGFSALPGGYRTIYGEFEYSDLIGYWWSVTASGSTAAYGREIDGREQIVRKYYWKLEGLSVRCIKNAN